MGIRVPLTNGVSEGSLGNTISPNNGLKGLKASSDLYAAGGNVGQQAYDTQVKLARVENTRRVSQLKSDYRRITAEYQNDLAKNHDTDTWVNGYYEKIAAHEGAVGELSPEARDQWDTWSADYISGQELRIARDATLRGIRNAGIAHGTQIQEYKDRGEWDNVYSAIEDNIGVLYSKEEGARRMQQAGKEHEVWEYNEQQKAMANDIMVNPFEAESKIEDKSYYPSLTDYERNVQRAKIKRAIATKRQEIGAGIADKIFDGSISSVNQIEEMGGKLRPKSLAILKDTLGRKFAREMEGIRLTPEQQTGLIGQANSLIDNYQPDANDEGYDTQIVAIQEAMEGIEDGAPKRELERRLKRVRSNNFGEIKDVRDAGFKLLSDGYKAGVFGKVDEIKMVKRSVRDHVGDGFFKDKEKLKSLGFSDDQIEDLQEADEQIDGSGIFWDDDKVTAGAQADKFKELWSKRTGEVVADNETLRLANDLAKGRKSLDTFFSEDEDSASRLQSDRQNEQLKKAYGQAQSELAGWLEMHPKADANQVAEKVRSLGVSATSEVIKPSITSPRPKRKSLSTPPISFKMTHSSAQGLKDRAQSGGATVLLDSNWKGGDGITSPLVVIPNNATPLQRKAAQQYADQMAELHKEKFGRDLKPRVVTRKENGRGRAYAIHTEGFAVTDTDMVKYLQTEKGKAEYLGILNGTLGAIPGVEFNLPHSSTDPGAVHNGVSEVGLAEWFMKK